MEDVPGDWRGEVKVPGHGWRACVLAGPIGDPIQFFDEDDGWNPVPKATFAEDPA